MPLSEETRMTQAAPPLDRGLGASAPLDKVVHTVTQDKDGMCCTRMACIPLDPLTGEGSLHINAATLMSTVGSTHPDLHNMKGVEVLDSRVSGMSGPCGVSFMFGHKDEGFKPLDTISRMVSHAPTRADMWHHIATTASQKPMPPNKCMMRSGFVSKEQQGVAAAVAAWPQDMAVSEGPGLSEIGSTHVMYPIDKPPCLAAVVMEKNLTNPSFLGGNFKHLKTEHPNTKAEMRVVTKADFTAAGELAGDARTVKHDLATGINLSVRPLDASIKPIDGQSPTAIIQWRTVHDPASECNIVAQTHAEMSSALLKSVVTGTALGAENGSGGAAATVTPVMSPEDLAAHVMTTLKIGEGANLP